MADNTSPETVRDALFSPQQVTAYVRAAWQAGLTFAGTAATAVLYLDTTWAEGATLAAIPVLIALGWRGVAEGTFDAYRNAHGNVKPSDVGAYDPPIAPR
jgi:cyanophycinase-like exopeptidase